MYTGNILSKVELEHQLKYEQSRLQQGTIHNTVYAFAQKLLSFVL